MTDMREKVKEYINELQDEIDNCVKMLEEEIYMEVKHPEKYAAITMRIQTIGEVKQDLTNRLDELI